MYGYQAIPTLLHRSGFRVVFGMVGGTNVPWLGEGVEANLLRLISVRHEETAVSAAAGYSRATGALGICTVQRGPGFANSINALIDATQSHVPLLLIVSQSPAVTPGKDQNIDQEALTRIVGAGFKHADVSADLEHAYELAVRDAYRTATPQVLSVGEGVLKSRVHLGSQGSYSGNASEDEHEMGEGEIRSTVGALQRAQRPLILAGAGALVADCRAELEELAELTGAQVASTLRANRFFSGNPHDLGLCGGWSPEPVREVLEEIDLVLAVGASLNRHTTADGELFDGAKVIQCDIAARERDPTKMVPGRLLLGDARTTVEALIAEWKRQGLAKRPVQAHTPSSSEIREALCAVDLGHDSRRGLDLRDVYVALDSKLPSDRIVVTDSGNFLGTLPSLVDARDGRSWLVGRGWASIGLCLGLAVGAAAAHPKRPVVAFCGDGGFMMAVGALDAVRVNDLSLTVIIMNDEQYGSDIKRLTDYGLPKDIVRQGLPDVSQLASAFGGSGVVIRSLEQLAELTIPCSGLFLVDVRIDPEVNGRAAF